MVLKILGKIWRLRWVAPHERPRTAGGTMRDGEKGCCEAPNVPGKSIMVRDNMTDEETLDTLIHECLHAGAYDMLSEYWVGHMGTDLKTAILKVFEIRRRG